MPGAIDAAVFLGDGADDLSAASAQAGFTVPWYKVRGNGDFDFSIPDSLILEISGEEPSGESGLEPFGPGGDSDIPPRKFFLAHGNRHGVEGGGQTIAAAARNVGAEAAFFGHTHVPYCAMLNGIFLLNPGSIGRPRSNSGPTFAILECLPAGRLSVRFFGLAKRGREIIVKELKL